MDDGETIQERQEAELGVLKSIYDKDLKDLRECDVWKISRPPEFVLTLRPNYDSRGEWRNVEDRCSVNLRVQFSDTYPETPPKVIFLEKGKLLTETDFKNLENLIQDHCKNNLGEVMIMDIALKISSWLLEIDRRPRFKSFYDEMEARHEQLKVEKELKQRQEREDAEKQRELIQQEIARAAEQIKEEKLQRKEECRRKRESSSIFGSAASVINRRRSSVRSSVGGGQYSESSDVGHPEDGPVEQVYYVHKGERVMVNKGNRIGGINCHGGSVNYGIVASTGKMVAISVWIFKTHPENKKATFINTAEYYDEQTVLRQLSSIEQEMSSILKVQKSHPHIVQYMGMSHINTGKSIIVRVFEEFVPGSNLSFYLSENLCLDLNVLRYYSVGILEALDHMHDKNVVHRDLRDTSVYVTNDGCVKVGNWSWDKRIRDMIFESDAGGGANGIDTAKFPCAIGRGGKKVDIYRFGILALSLSNGFIVQDAIPCVPKSTSPDFADFLKKCFIRDERDRWTAAQLLEHVFLKEKIIDNPVLEEGSPPVGDYKEIENRDDPLENEEDEDQTLKLYNPSPIRGVSRLNDEFELISRIGRGGFGEVIKVKNRLDGQIYAIKKIKLNPDNKSVTKKIMREVKLLSRLNHENVVRYYNSWMEVATLDTESETDDESNDERSSSFTQCIKRQKGKISNLSPFKTPRDLVREELSNNEFNLSYSSHQFFEEDDENDELNENVDNDDDDDEVFGTSFLPRSWEDRQSDEEEDDDGIIFKNPSSESRNDDGDEVPVSCLKKKTENLKKIVLSQFLYIQMELCDKQTLRNAIDQDLYKDTKRVWRMFREIIEGLLHIHTQGMIHRDLKPVNVFIDASDHVKIGDFGLATTSFITGTKDEYDYNESLSLDVSTDGASLTADMTGQVGTAMYIAPEMLKTRTSTYNQKVDIYSLGIIFFEMCYHPLTTGMERIKILTDLRSEEIKFPPDFDKRFMVQQYYLILWLLNHDPISRPSSFQLLQSDYLPPPQVEEAEVRELVRHTLKNTQSKTYHHLIDACLAQRMGLTDDLKYDMEIPKTPVPKRKRILHTQEKIRAIATAIFRRHGAVCVNVPIFIPKGKRTVYDTHRDNLVEVMTRNGGVVSLPYDLRIHFARYLAKTGINSIRRYCIAPVYQEDAVLGVTPKGFVECAFDIVSSDQGNLISDAESILVVDELIRELGVKERNHFVRLNHILLIKGLLNHCGVDEEQYPGVYDILRERRSTKLERHKRLLNIGLSEQVISTLTKFLDREGSIQEIASHFKHITKRNNQAGLDVKKAVHELQMIITNCGNIGVECELIVAPSLVHNPRHFSGMFCHVVRKKANYHKTKQCDVVAAGGRYDSILNKLYSEMSLCSDSSTLTEPYNHSAVGISISMDKAVKIALENSSYSSADVVLCSVGTGRSRERCEIAKRIWSLGLSLYLCDSNNSPNEAQDLCQEIGAFVLVIIPANNALDIRVMTWDKKDPRVMERKMPIADLYEFLQKYFIASFDSDDLNEDFNLGLCGTSSSSVATVSGGPSGMNYGSSMKFRINYNFKFLDRQRNTSFQKKRLESTISGRIQSSLSAFSHNNIFELLAISLPGCIVKSLAAFLDFESEFKFEISVKDIMEKHIRYRKDVQNICEEIRELRFIKQTRIIIIYSSDDHIFKFIVC